MTGEQPSSWSRRGLSSATSGRWRKPRERSARLTGRAGNGPGAVFSRARPIARHSNAASQAGLPAARQPQLELRHLDRHRGGVRSAALTTRFAVTMNSSIGSAESTGCTVRRFAVTTITSMPASGTGAGAATFVPAAKADVTVPSDNERAKRKANQRFHSVSPIMPCTLSITRERVVWLHGWREESRRTSSLAEERAPYGPLATLAGRGKPAASRRLTRRQQLARALPVCDALHAAISSGVPQAISWPPLWPPSGPRSMT